MCMPSRHTRINAQGPLLTLSNEELIRLERHNRQHPRPTNTTMGDNRDQDDLTAAMALMQQQMQQMQQTINAQQAAQQAAAELAAQFLDYMTSSSLTKNKENDRSKNVNSIHDLAAKVDQLIKRNQSQVFIMEEAAPENNALDVTPEADNTVDDQQEVSYVKGQVWQYKNYHPNPNVRNNAHLFAYPKLDKPAQHNQFKNQKQQTAQQIAPAPTTAPLDELKGLGMMMQQLFQGQQVQAKALNQVTTDINNRMDNMFTELSTKYDTVASHIRKMDAQIAQTAKSVKKHQGTLPGKSVMNPRVDHCNATELRSSFEVTAPDEPTEIPPVRVYLPKIPYPIPPRHFMDPISAEQLAGFRKMGIRLPQNISFEHAWEIRPLHMFFKNFRETQEEINALFTESLTPVLRVLPKVDDPGKFSFPCSIAGVELKEALCDSGSSVNLVSKVIVNELGIVDVEHSLLTLAFANSYTTVPYSTIRNLTGQVGDCIIHSEFQVVEMSKDYQMPLIFGRSFMVTVGEIIDLPNKRVFFSNISKKVFYKVVPTKSQI
ncbi:hypothetical protein DY000_02041059 [Brassica cretica]|uniref:Aspartic peptidase DDI1-type domain-containing protein n=1 Tax=Brassica cretica TaxID=69181 RepID=A0ABQ7B6U7_BRACR|nr:hypothetical protein DY000_02041059 [Brassica cretica]